jgi:hypothetical protein
LVWRRAGFLLGPLVASYLGVGFVEIRKDKKYDGDHGLGLCEVEVDLEGRVVVMQPPGREPAHVDVKRRIPPVVARRCGG